VDVLVELPVPDSKGEHFSKTLLQNVVVLTAGQAWEQSTEKKPVLVNTVTLELTPEEAEILNLASNQGKIRLALRGRNNKVVVQTAGVATSQLIVSRPKKELPPQRDRGVEVIKGVERSKTAL
jgi:pilus assembly protein CpaB